MASAPQINCDVVTVCCAVCGVQKKQSNHWWMAWVNHMREFVSDVYDPVSWSALRDRYEIRAVACGEEHAQQLYARWLVGRDFLAPSQRPSTRARDGEPESNHAASKSPDGSITQSPDPLPAPDSSTPQEEK